MRQGNLELETNKQKRCEFSWQKPWLYTFFVATLEQSEGLRTLEVFPSWCLNPGPSMPPLPRKEERVRLQLSSGV